MSNLYDKDACDMYAGIIGIIFSICVATTDQTEATFAVISTATFLWKLFHVSMYLLFRFLEKWKIYKCEFKIISFSSFQPSILFQIVWLLRSEHKKTKGISIEGHVLLLLL